MMMSAEWVEKIMSNAKLAKMFEEQASEIENKSNPSKSKKSGRGKERKQRRWKGH
jgi:hypothetical protein